MKSSPSRNPNTKISRGMWLALAAALALTAASYGVRGWREHQQTVRLEDEAAAAATAAAATTTESVAAPTLNAAPIAAQSTTPSNLPLPSAPASTQTPSPILISAPPQATEVVDESITIINPANGLPMTLPPGTPLPPGVKPLPKMTKPPVAIPPPASIPNAAAPIPPAVTSSPPASVPPAAAPPGLRVAAPAAANDAMSSRRNAPPAPTASVEATPPANNALPAPTFRLIGRYVDGKKSQAFFVHNDATIAAKAGEALPEGFRLRTIHADKVIVVRQSNQEKIEMPLGTP